MECNGNAKMGWSWCRFRRVLVVEMGNFFITFDVEYSWSLYITTAELDSNCRNSLAINHLLSLAIHSTDQIDLCRSGLAEKW